MNAPLVRCDEPAFTLAGISLAGFNFLFSTVAGLAIVQCAKAWFIERAVLLFEDMKTRDPAYAAWEYPAPPAP